MTDLLEDIDQIEIAGGAAFLRGAPCESPEYGKEMLRARWRLGWKKEQARQGQKPDGNSLYYYNLWMNCRTENERMRECLLAMSKADGVGAGSLKTAAYDVVMNCVTADILETRFAR